MNTTLGIFPKLFLHILQGHREAPASCSRQTMSSIQLKSMALIFIDLCHTDNSGTVKAGPAMFPVDYTKSDVKGFPWICAVRSCRLVYKTAAGLANHARVSHL